MWIGLSKCLILSQSCCLATNSIFHFSGSDSSAALTKCALLKYLTVFSFVYWLHTFANVELFNTPLTCQKVLFETLSSSSCLPDQTAPLSGFWLTGGEYIMTRWRVFHNQLGFHEAETRIKSKNQNELLTQITGPDVFTSLELRIVRCMDRSNFQRFVVNFHRRRRGLPRLVHG